MKRQAYSLNSKWTVNAPLDVTWQALSDPRVWQEWWPDIKHVKQLESPQLVAIRWRGVVGFALHIVIDIEDFKEQEFIRHQYSGDIAGQGDIRLKAKNKQTTIVTFDYEIKTIRPWMNYLAKWLKKTFVATYERGMVRAEKGLNKYLAEK